MYLIVLIISVLTISCKPNHTPRQNYQRTVDTVDASREQMISGEVEKKWVLSTDDDSKKKKDNDETDVRYIFYRNYNLTTFGMYGSRQGHWSLDDNEILSFHFDGPDSLKLFTLLKLDSN